MTGQLDRLDGRADDPELTLGGSAIVAALVGAGLAWATRTGATQLLVAVAAAQALLGFGWMLVLRVPGRRGGVLLAALAAAGADVAASVWPHSRLAALLGVIALAVPVMFVHQLLRGAARVRVGESFGGIALLIVFEAALAALLQVRHEFPGTSIGGDAAFAVVVATVGALVAGYFTDMVLPAPRFDEHVPRGLVAVVLSTVVGALLGHLVLRDSPVFGHGRGAFVGAALGVLAALVAVAVAFVETGVPFAEAGFARRGRPVLSVLVPLAVVAPVGLLLCLAIRS